MSFVLFPLWISARTWISVSWRPGACGDGGHAEFGWFWCRNKTIVYSGFRIDGTAPKRWFIPRSSVRHFYRVRRRTSNSGVFLDLVRRFFQVTLCGFSRLCILCGLHFFEVKPTTDAMILFAKCARLPVPLFSHSTGFSMVHTGSIRSV